MGRLVFSNHFLYTVSASNAIGRQQTLTPNFFEKVALDRCGILEKILGGNELRYWFGK